MKKKKQGILLFTVLLFPSLLYVFLSTGKHHFINVGYCGPKQAYTHVVEGKERSDTLYYTVPSFKFVGQTGDTITDKFFAGKIYIADFFFTSCTGSSPEMQAQLLRVKEKINRPDVLFLSHTVDPKIDSVKILAAYAEKYKADPKQWILVTGNRDSLYKMQNYYLQDIEMGNEDEPRHGTDLILVDKEKHIRAMYDGTSTVEVDKMIDDIKVLIASYEIERKKKEKRGTDNE